MKKLTHLESIELELVPTSKKDEKIIKDCLAKEIELYVDETTNHVITESGIYIADLIEVKEEEIK